MNTENTENTEVNECVKAIYHLSNQRKENSLKLFNLYVAPSIDAVSCIEDILENDDFMKELKGLFVSQLPKDKESSKYGKGLVSDFELYKCKPSKISNLLRSHNISLSEPDVKTLSKARTNLVDWIGRLVRTTVEDFPLERRNPKHAKKEDDYHERLTKSLKKRKPQQLKTRKNTKSKSFCSDTKQQADDADVSDKAEEEKDADDANNVEEAEHANEAKEADDGDGAKAMDVVSNSEEAEQSEEENNVEEAKEMEVSDDGADAEAEEADNANETEEANDAEEATDAEEANNAKEATDAEEAEEDDGEDVTGYDNSVTDVSTINFSNIFEEDYPDRLLGDDVNSVTDVSTMLEQIHLCILIGKINDNANETEFHIRKKQKREEEQQDHYETDGESVSSFNPCVGYNEYDHQQFVTSTELLDILWNNIKFTPPCEEDIMVYDPTRYNNNFIVKYFEEKGCKSFEANRMLKGTAVVITNIPWCSLNNFINMFLDEGTPFATLIPYYAIDYPSVQRVITTAVGRAHLLSCGSHSTFIGADGHYKKIPFSVFWLVCNGNTSNLITIKKEMHESIPIIPYYGQYARETKEQEGNDFDLFLNLYQDRL